MNNYKSNNSKKKLVKEVFDKSYKNYDLMNDIMSLGIYRLWKNYLINNLDLSSKKVIIDMASGTGDLTKTIEKNSLHKHEIYRIDPNFNMLHHNQDTFKNSENIKTICAYAEDIPVKNNFADIYLISFGLRNVSNIDRCLAEAYRILKPGGRFLSLEFYKIQTPILKQVYDIYSKMIPMFGQLVNKDSKPYQYLTTSIREFFSQEEVDEKIKQQKFRNSNYTNLYSGIVSIHSAWKFDD